jgi:HTH-type transcriptional regulator / antitoxin HigA
MNDMINSPVKPIRTKEEYQEALDQIELLLEAEPGTPETDRLEVLSILVHDYEEKAFPMPKIDPIEAIKYQAEEMGLTSSDLAVILGGKNRVSEVFSRKRALSLRQIKSVVVNMHIPAETLLAL